MSFVDFLPSLNAGLNATSGVLLLLGWRAIRAKRFATHWRFMLAAVATSTVFLTSYLIRVALTGAHRYPAADWTRTVYYVILVSHSLLAATVVPFVARLLYLAARRRYRIHRRLARWVFPVWMYVSVTGVVVYAMLYHLGPALAR